MKIIIVLLVTLFVVFPGMVQAIEPKENLNTSKTSFHDQPDFTVESGMVDPAFRAGGTTAIMTDKEEVMITEKWMVKLDQQYWEKTTGERAIQLESWMTDIQHSKWNNSSSESELIIESWMLDLSSWATS